MLRRAFSTATTQHGIIQTPKAFLDAIGRDCSQYAQKVPSWDAFLTATSPQLKEWGVDVSRRKYILRWLDWYKQGVQPFDIPLRAKQQRGPKWRY